jgi:hypothetical protein
MGLDGVEAYHPNTTLQKCRRLEDMSRALGLKVTAGSDYHGNLRKDRKLGLCAGGKPVSDDYLKIFD